jgi:ribosomal protein L29
MKKAYEYRDMTLDALVEAVAEESENVMTMRMQLGARTLDNPLNYRETKRNLARMKTVLTEMRRDSAAKE